MPRRRRAGSSRYGIVTRLGEVAPVGLHEYRTTAERAYRRHEKEHTTSLADPGPASAAKENLAGARGLPVPSDSVAALNAKSPGDTEEFRTLVTNAVTQAAQSTDGGTVDPARAEMTHKIKNALAG
ncbi:hypothetical protein ACGFY7_15665 [Streptomyces prunicolor]|uniref:hypothetical protein n=1 Tax=Streptomyces prunicolor TaxID=67348 RepID=UPI0037107569